jgi:hypothetical protein
MKIRNRIEKHRPFKRVTSAEMAQPPGWRAALLVASYVGSSALLGGVALVIWNRKALAHMREPRGAIAKLPEQRDLRDDPEEFI